jgi:hypothetical protein
MKTSAYDLSPDESPSVVFRIIGSDQFDVNEQGVRMRTVAGYDIDRPESVYVCHISSAPAGVSYLHPSFTEPGEGTHVVVSLFGHPGGRAVVLTDDIYAVLPMDFVERVFALPPEDAHAVTALIRYALMRVRGNINDGISYQLLEVTDA